MSKIVLRLQKVLDDRESEVVGTIEIPPLSNVMITLGRDEMGVVKIVDSEAQSDELTVNLIHTLQSKLNKHEYIIAMLGMQTGDVYNALQSVLKLVE